MINPRTLVFVRITYYSTLKRIFSVTAIHITNYFNKFMTFFVQKGFLSKLCIKRCLSQTFSQLFLFCAYFLSAKPCCSSILSRISRYLLIHKYFFYKRSYRCSIHYDMTVHFNDHIFYILCHSLIIILNL